MLALAIVTALAFVQEEMATYREALFEEVDRGNLEKARELYGRVAKAASDATLRGKAAVRAAHCLEKLGRAKEAEQEFRTALEKHANVEDAAKFARERLAVLGGAAGGGLQDSAVAQLIIQLGLDDEKKREEAIRMLVLRGAVEDLRRAVVHKDPVLSMGAADALVQLEQYNGLLDVYARGFTMQKFRHADQIGFVQLLRAHPESLARAVAGEERLDKVLTVAVSISSELRVPAVRDRLAAKAMEDDDNAARAWSLIAKAEELAPFIEKLLVAGKSKAALRLLHVNASTPGRGKLSPAALSALAVPEMAGHRVLLDIIARWTTPAEYLDVLVTGWVRSPALSPVLLRTILAPPVDGENQEWLTEQRERTPAFLVRVLEDGAAPDKVRRTVARVAAEHTLDAKQRTSLAQYFGSLATAGKLGDLEALSIAYMAESLPDDAPELEAAFDRLMKTDHSIEQPASEVRRRKYFDAALRALASPDPQVQLHAVRMLDGANAREHIIRAIPGVPALHEDVRGSMISMIGEARRDAPAKARAALAAAAAALMAAAPADVRRDLAATLQGFDEADWNDAMKAALNDEDETLREAAVGHWAELVSRGGRQVLINALKDPSDNIRIRAISGLSAAPSIEAAPALIEVLRAPNEDVRKQAREALEKIKTLAEEQEKWRKWLEEARKAEKK